MKQKLKKFLEDHRDKIQPLLENSKFEELYNYIETEAEDFLFGYKLCSAFTEILLNSGINPLMYVDKVPDGYLYESKNVPYVFIPKNIRYIGFCAFESSNIQQVDIAEDSNLAEIASEAFTNCKNLKSITLPKSLQTVESEAFYLMDNLRVIYEGSQQEFEDLHIDEDAFGSNVKIEFKG